MDAENNERRWAVVVYYRDGSSQVHWSDYHTAGCAERDAEELRQIVNPELATVVVENSTGW